MSDTVEFPGSAGSDPASREQVPFVSPAAQTATAEATAAAGAQAGPAAGGAAYGAATSAIPPVGGWGPVTGAYAAAPPPPPAGVVGSPSDPNPAVAFWLGLIPGVGAMYNGQVAKGFVHLIVFIVLVAIANNVNGIFGLFVTGWIFFMAFEAYHTAKAKRAGLPLPNAFGWNDIGERMGLGRNWPFSPGVPAAAPTQGAAQGFQAAAGGGANPGGWTSVPPVAPSAQGYGAGPTAPMGAGYGVAPNWAGYVPPVAFAGAPPVGAAGAPTSAAEPAAAAAAGAAVPPGHGVPYVPVNTGAAYSNAAYPGAPNAMEMAPVPSRLPVGAIWLIGLGVLFLLGQWTPLLQVSRVWIPSLLLAGLGVFLFARRMGWTGSSAWQPTASLPLGLRVASAVRVPGILVAVAILNGLHEAWVVRWDRSWPWLLIAIGVLLLVERIALRQAAAVNAGVDPAQTGEL